MEQKALVQTLHRGDIVSIQAQNDPYPSVGRVVEVVGSDDLALYTYRLLVNPGTDYLPYWVHVDAQTVVRTLIIGETYWLRTGTHQGEQVRFSRLLEKVSTALVTLEDGSEYYCPAWVLNPREDVRGDVLLSTRKGAETMVLQATYTPHGEIWGYRLCIAGMYSIQAVKQLATDGERAIPDVLQNG